MVLTIRWQRLVSEEGKTCDRCGGTQEEVRQAVKNLTSSLRPLGMQVALREEKLSPKEFAKDVSESNRIWIADRPLEEWLSGEVGMSPCGFCCSELDDSVECRTLSVDGRTYEVVPAQLIVKAGLMAASEIMKVPSTGKCCPAGGTTGKEGKECCPESGRDKDKTAKKPI